MTVYRSTAVVQLDQAQAELYEHLLSDAGGRCATCHETEPCGRRHELTAAILSYGALPHRRPGLTKAGLRRTEVR